MSIVNGKRAEYLGLEWLDAYVETPSEKRSDEKIDSQDRKGSFQREVRMLSNILRQMDSVDDEMSSISYKKTLVATSSYFSSSSIGFDRKQVVVQHRVEVLSTKIGSMQLEPLLLPTRVVEKKSWFEEISVIANEPLTQDNMDLITTACVLKAGAKVADLAGQIMNAGTTMLDWAGEKTCNLHPTLFKVCTGILEGNTRMLNPILDQATDVINSVGGLKILQGVRGDIEAKTSKNIGISEGLEELMLKDIQTIRNAIIEHKAPDKAVTASDAVLNRANERGLIHKN